jgi:flagellar biosynthesis GTPase FlhF
MATIKVFDGETVVKELHTDLNVDDIAARLEAQPHEIALSVDGQPVVLEVLVHPTMKDTIDSVLAKARKKAEDVKGVDEDVDVKDEGDEDEEDERFKRLLALLEEAESDEDEEEESKEEEKASHTLNELVKAVKELREAVAKLQASEPKTEEVKKERAKQPVILKSWAPYERAQKFEQPKETELEKGQPTGIDPQAISDFQKELMKRLRVLP